MRRWNEQGMRRKVFVGVLVLFFLLMVAFLGLIWGTLSASLVHPREVFKPAILESAASIILLHNHPSGDPTPSREDLRLTQQLVECSQLLDLRIHDHVIIGRERFISFAQRGAI